MSLVDLGKRLLEAAKRGETDTVRALMSNGAPFTTDWLGTSPLHFAAQHGHQQTAEVLLRSGISRDARTKVDRTPLHVAAQEGHLDIVDLLLQNTADIDAKDMLKMTPLHWATEKGHVGIIDLLVRSGADLNSDDKFDRTPLDIAMANGRTDIAQMLQLAHHTDIGAVSESETITIETSEPIMTETVTTSHQVKTEVSSDSEQSSTSVLATLAALAEATGPIAANTTSAEAVNWLESQGITMISATADGGLITSAVESGQTITLTEAGKIALNYIRQDGLGDASHEEAGLEAVVGNDGQKVITIVANQGAEQELREEEEERGGRMLVQVAEDGTHIPMDAHMAAQVEGGVLTEEVGGDLHHLDGGNGTLIIEEGDGTTITVSQVDQDAHEVDDSQNDLRRQLEAVQRQAEEYKQQLRAKEEEAEQFRQRLSQIETVAVTTEDGVPLTTEDGVPLTTEDGELVMTEEMAVVTEEGVAVMTEEDVAVTEEHGMVAVTQEEMSVVTEEGVAEEMSIVTEEGVTVTEDGMVAVTEEMSGDGVTVTEEGVTVTEEVMEDGGLAVTEDGVVSVEDGGLVSVSGEEGLAVTEEGLVSVSVEDGVVVTGEEVTAEDAASLHEQLSQLGSATAPEDS